MSDQGDGNGIRLRNLIIHLYGQNQLGIGISTMSKPTKSGWNTKASIKARKELQQAKDKYKESKSSADKAKMARSVEKFIKETYSD